jgi:DNA helicase-2/ATP-dependent DNA helicase PcrA
VPLLRVRPSPALPGSGRLIEAIDLTEEQAAIVRAGLSGPYVVDAGAGTGKTYTLVRRARHLVAEKALAPSQILIVTFMKKAANEIGDRLTATFKEFGEVDIPICTTFHALAASLLREFAYEAGHSPDFRAIDDFRARGVFARAYEDLICGRLDVALNDFPILERGKVLQRSLATAALDLKNRGISPDEFEQNALTAADALRDLPFGQLFTRGRSGRPIDLDPKDCLSPEQLRREGESEARNVLVVAALFRRFDELLAAEALATYGDLLTRAIAMLRDHPAIVTRLRKRWHHAMVDEFQDTNPQQLAFLRALFGDELVPVMAVGDVRQAIFEWNGADPAGITRIAATEGVTTFPLSRNRRSPQQILDAAHHVLPVNAPYRGDVLNAHKGLASHVCLRHASFGLLGTTAENRETEANAVAGEIEQLLAGGVPTHEIAILLRSRTHARVYSTALARLGIPSKTHGGVGFYDAPEIRDAVAWLRLIEDPTNAFALARVLESAAIGFSHGSVAQFFQANTGTADSILLQPTPEWMTPGETERLVRFRAILRKLGASVNATAPDAVRAMLRETCVDMAHTIADPASAPQIRANAAKLVALATGFADERPLATLSDFLAEIDERDALEVDESEAELSGDEISIMTIHSAKGLEWDYVFLVNVAHMVFPNTSGRNDQIVDLGLPSRALAMRYDCDGAMPFRWTLRQPHDPLTGERLAKPERDEESRLFYVALTRAKHVLWVSGPRKGDGSKFLRTFREFCEGRTGAEAFNDEIMHRPAAAKSAKARLVGGDGSERIFQRLKWQRILFELPAAKLSYTSIAAYATCARMARYRYVLRVPDIRPDAAPTVEFADEESGSHAKLDAATYGSIVHLALETIARGRIADEPTSVEAAVDLALIESECENDTRLRERVARAVGRAVEELEALEPIDAEAEFNVEIARASVGGFIDLIARDATGEILVIDYKTGHLPDQSYALQLALYCVAIEQRYPDAKAAILRINDDVVELVSPPLPKREAVEELVHNAAAMCSYEPTPGIHCLSCPYAGRLCPEGAAALERTRV